MSSIFITIAGIVLPILGGAIGIVGEFVSKKEMEKHIDEAINERIDEIMNQQEED